MEFGGLMLDYGVWDFRWELVSEIVNNETISHHFPAHSPSKLGDVVPSIAILILPK